VPESYLFLCICNLILLTHTLERFPIFDLVDITRYQPINKYLLHGNAVLSCMKINESAKFPYIGTTECSHYLIAAETESAVPQPPTDMSKLRRLGLDRHILYVCPNTQ